ncbi:MAG: CvpA family protein [candidate division WOR-3 bacterium]
MNIFDFIIIGLIVACGFFGFFEGFPRILIEVCGILIAIYLSFLVHSLFIHLFPWNLILSVVTFFLVLSISIIIARFVGKIGKLLPLSNFFGGIFGLLIGLVFSFYLISFIYKFFPGAREIIDNSFILKYLTEFKEFWKSKGA